MRSFTRRHSAFNLKNLLYGTLLVLMLGGMGYATFRSYGKPMPDAFGCYEGIQHSSTFVLVDASEPRFNEEQARSLRSYFNQLFDTLAFNERLSFFTSEADQIASIAKPRFYVCGPATSPEQLEEIGAATGQAGFLKKQKERLYAKIVVLELDAMLKETPDENRRQLYQSPIMEMIGDFPGYPVSNPVAGSLLPAI